MKGHVPARWVRVGVVSMLLGVLLGVLVVPPLLRASDELAFTTGHTINNTYGFLNYWREHSGERLLGNPITKPFTENDLTVQYFEHGRLELHTELEGTPILLGRVGVEYTEALWRTFEAVPGDDLQPNDQFFSATGHTLRDPFLSFWNNNDGITMFGYPISEPVWEYAGAQMLQVQYFERGRLEYHPLAAGTPDEVQISPLGRDLALLRGVDMTPEPIEPPPPPPPTPKPAPAGIAETRPAQGGEKRVAPAPARPAAPAGAVAAVSSGKSIVVDLSAQWLYAFEDGAAVYDAPVSTGRDGFNTPPGNFAIYSKLSSQTMSGTIGGESYYVPDVPNVMYINGGVALHGTYWHNMFGSGVRMSHGCINLPLGAASWLYSWAPMGTPVTVRW